jgi:hypothetical protein
VGNAGIIQQTSGVDGHLLGIGAQLFLPERPIRPADEIYNAKVGGASSPQKPKEVSPTKKLLPSSQFPLSFFTGSTQVAILHFHLCE